MLRPFVPYGWLRCAQGETAKTGSSSIFLIGRWRFTLKRCSMSSRCLLPSLFQPSEPQWNECFVLRLILWSQLSTNVSSSQSSTKDRPDSYKREERGLSLSQACLGRLFQSPLPAAISTTVFTKIVRHRHAEPTRPTSYQQKIMDQSTA